jgi:PAS domain S-box-containing protein
MRTERELSRKQADTPGESIDVQRLYQYLSERSPLPMIAVEGVTHLVRYVNPAFCRLAETKGEDLLGKPFGVAVPEGEENRCRAVLDSVYHTGGAENLMDQVHQQATSERSYWSYSVWAILDVNDRPSGVMIHVTDTTEQTLTRQQLGNFNQTLLLSGLRQQELTAEAETGIERLQRFMRETDHRAKNNLQIIVALLDMHMMENAESVCVGVLEQMRLHIQTVAAFHDLLTHLVKDESSESIVSATVMLTKLMPMWQKIVGAERFRWSAENNLLLSVKKGMSLALLINEAVTNAVKHGGKEVELRLVGNGNSATLTVSDNGPGFPPAFDPSTSAHFGLEFVESVVRLELNGQLTYANSPGGACITVTFPVP